MLLKTNFKYAPWFVVKADDKSKAHIAIITHLLGELEYQKKDKKLLSNSYGEVFPADGENIDNKLF